MTLLCAALCAAILGTAFGAALPVVAQADESVVFETVQATIYLSGGPGEGEQGRTRRIATEFPLRLTFSTFKDGEYLADRPVEIQDMKGPPAIELSRARPIPFVSLRDGRYKVLARYKDRTEWQQVSVGGKSGKALSVHWADSTEKP